ncbi:hypothetical protein [Winogradskyella aurantia]|uniref:Uncharacterized protein n=1 Tax=Winogradskyella aurantia TaxID=1915063 RepID=A0A265UVQ8_9FLAO|nr:hypothetical protein [Winogradskyella aurantia]OZV69378.1 hypothetical protein CA834_07965 [Winogradskyella aurantia]
MKRYSTIFLSSIFFIIIGCTSYKPFSNVKEKKKASKNIRNTFKLTNDEFKLIKSEDSILYEISESMTKKVKFQTTNRRIDSFINGNYSKRELIFILNVDQLKGNGEFDFDYTNQFDGRRLNFKTIEEYKKFMNKLDSSFTKKVKVKVDSLKNK